MRHDGAENGGSLAELRIRWYVAEEEGFEPPRPSRA